MSYWSVNSEDARRLVAGWLSCWEERRLIVVDGGAAGEVSEPFDQISAITTVVRFEPRGKDVVESQANDILIDGALWSEDTELELNIAQRPSTSSILGPNSDFLSRYDDYYGVPPRSTIQSIPVAGRSLDSCVLQREIPQPDAIKLDVHGSELPALVGAEQCISDVALLLVETWNAEVHVGQGLHHEVEGWVNHHGFELFDQKVAASWRHKYRGSVCEADKPQVVGMEALYIRADRGLSPDTIASKVFFLGLFGYINAALLTLDGCDSMYKRSMEPLRDALIRVQASRSVRHRKSGGSRLRQRIRGVRAHLRRTQG